MKNSLTQTSAPESVVLSIIVVNWNTRELLARCLASVYGTAAGLEFEVFVVDNGSFDGSAAMAQERFPQTRLIGNVESVGFARANNQAICESRGRYAVLLNSDTEVLPDALPALVEFMGAHPETGAAGPCLLNADGSLQPSCHPLLTPGREFWRLLFLDALWPRATYPMRRWDRSPRRVEVVKGACLILRRAALEQVGLLDESFFMYSEEMHLCYRLARAGWKLYWVPGAQVIHYGEGSTRQAAQAMYVQLYRSKVQFYRKTGGRGRARLFQVLVALAYLPRWLAAAAVAPFAAGFPSRARTYRRLLAELPGM